MEKIKQYFDIRLLAIAVISALIHSFTFANFTVPGKLYPGGFSGISRIVSDILLRYFSISVSFTVFYFSMNAIVSLLVFRYIGKKFTIYSIIQFALVSLISDRLPRILVISDPLLLSLFGGICNGAAVGLALDFNFSTAGFDFLSVFYSTKYKKQMWNYVFYVNALILSIAGLLFGFDRAMYSIVFQYVSTSVVKRMHKRFTHITITVITKKPDAVADNILKHVRHGITELDASGYYSKTKTTMLYTVVNTFQKNEVIQSIREADPSAFINVQETIDVIGNYYQKPLD